MHLHVSPLVIFLFVAFFVVPPVVRAMRSGTKVAAVPDRASRGAARAVVAPDDDDDDLEELEQLARDAQQRLRARQLAGETPVAGAQGLAALGLMGFLPKDAASAIVAVSEAALAGTLANASSPETQARLRAVVTEATRAGRPVDADAIARTFVEALGGQGAAVTVTTRTRDARGGAHRTSATPTGADARVRAPLEARSPLGALHARSVRAPLQPAAPLSPSAPLG